MTRQKARHTPPAGSTPIDRSSRPSPGVAHPDVMQTPTTIRSPSPQPAFGTDHPKWGALWTERGRPCELPGSSGDRRAEAPDNDGVSTGWPAGDTGADRPTPEPRARGTHHGAASASPRDRTAVGSRAVTPVRDPRRPRADGAPGRSPRRRRNPCRRWRSAGTTHDRAGAAARERPARSPRCS